MAKEIRINGVIGLDVTLESLKASLDAAQITPTDEVLFNISSPGGSVVTGFEIYNEIKNLQASKKIFQINGIAASIASIIVMAGDEIEASEFSLFMIHKASAGADGNADQLAQQIEVLKMIDELLVNTYFDRNQAKGTKKLNRAGVEEMLTAETWLSPSDALELGFIDRVVNKVSDVAKIAAQFNPHKNKSMDYLTKLRKLLAQGGKIEITLEDVKAAIAKALDGKTFTSLNEEEVNNFLVSVKAQLSVKAGGTLTEEALVNLDTLLNQAVNEITEQEAANTADGKIEALSTQIAELKNLVETMAKSSIETATQVENLTTDLVNTKKNIRSFGKKPFVNESSRLNLGSAYVDPYARHRKEMQEIEEKTRAKVKGA